MARSVDKAVRELCLAFPESEEFLSHGAPNFRSRGGKVFASYVVNHHGDGRVALWLKAADGAQEHFVRSDGRYYVPPYVGTRGWIGVELDTGLPWSEIGARVRESYLLTAKPRLAAAATRVPAVKPPDAGLAPSAKDPLQSPRAQAVLARMREACLALPETSEALQFGSPVWRAGKRVFAGLHAYEGPIRLSFWVGVDRQGLMVDDPRYAIPAYTGHNGWITLDVTKHADWDEVSALALDSYRHFALKRMLAQLPA